MKDSSFDTGLLTFSGKEVIVLADIDPKERAAARETWGFLKQRKPGEYGDLVK